MKKIIVIGILTLIGCWTLKQISKPFINSDTLMGRISNILNSNNTLELSSIGMNKNDIDVTWIPELDADKLIIKNGRQVGKIGYEYGPNRFKIKLPNEVEFNIGHFKTNNWHAHQYEIEIEKRDQGYHLKFEAKGPDAEHMEESFNLAGEQLDE